MLHRTPSLSQQSWHTPERVSRRLSALLPTCAFALALLANCGGSAEVGELEAVLETDQVEAALGSSAAVTYITSQAQLQAMNVAGNYKLSNDIVLTGNFTPIGTLTNPFMGTFDGNGKVIHNLNINRPTVQGNGLFAYADSAIIKRLALKNVNVIGTGVVGAIAGHARDSEITDSYVEGTVSGPTASEHTPAGALGLLVGVVYLTGPKMVPLKNLARSYGTGTVSGKAQYIGGLVGKLAGSYPADPLVDGNPLVFVDEVFANVNVAPTIYSSAVAVRAGGAFGYVTGAHLHHVLSVGTVTANAVNGNSYVGGVVGEMVSDGAEAAYSNYDAVLSRANVTVIGHSRAGSIGKLRGNLAHDVTMYDREADPGTPTSTVDQGYTTSELRLPTPWNQGVFDVSDGHWVTTIWGHGFADQHSVLRTIPNWSSVQPR